jgi:hypothetical protein
VSSKQCIGGRAESFSDVGYEIYGLGPVRNPALVYRCKPGVGTTRYHSDGVTALLLRC